MKKYFSRLEPCINVYENNFVEMAMLSRSGEGIQRCEDVEQAKGGLRFGEKELLKAFSRQLYLRGLFARIGLLEFSETGLTMKVDILQIGFADSAGIARLLLTHQGFEVDGKFILKRPIVQYGHFFWPANVFLLICVIA